MQNKEEIIKIWEDEGWEIDKINYRFWAMWNYKNSCGPLFINFEERTYGFDDQGEVDVETHKLLTKTMQILGWLE